MRLWRSSGKPPRYMSPSRSRISLPSLAEKGTLWLLMEMKPGGQAVSQRQLTQWTFFFSFFILFCFICWSGKMKPRRQVCVWVARRENKLLTVRKWTLFVCIFLDKRQRIFKSRLNLSSAKTRFLPIEWRRTEYNLGQQGRQR